MKKAPRRTAAEQASIDQANRGFEFQSGEQEFGDGTEREHEMQNSSIGVMLPENGQGNGLVLQPPSMGGELVSTADFTDIGDGVLPDGDESSGFASETARPLWRQMLGVFLENRLAIASSVVLVLIILFCYLGPHIYKTNQTNYGTVLLGCHSCAPSAQHLLGTDSTGFDMLGRIMYGGEYSLTVGALAGLITIVFGTVYGMISGFFGGILDGIMMRIVDALLAIPLLFLLITIVTIFSPSVTVIILVIGCTLWFGNARIIRGDALVIRELEYSQASTSMGASKMHIIRQHVFPNSISNIVTVGTFAIADAILFLATLGFLSLGVQPPGTDWGTMMAMGQEFILNGWWWQIWPVAFIFIVVIVCINYIGDALRDVFEVRLRKR